MKALLKQFDYKDHLGNTRVSLKEVAGALVKTAESAFDPYGVRLNGIGSVNSFQNRYEMQGKEKESTFGLNRVNFGARTLNPTTGVWDRIDPMSEKYFGFSPYNYTLNNPINAIDPDGNSVESFQGEAAQEAFRNHLAERGCPPNCGGGGGKTTATISPYKPDLADRMREGNILQRTIYGVADGVYSMFADNHLGGKAFENYDDKIKTKLGGFMTLASPLLSGGGATARFTPKRGLPLENSVSDVLGNSYKAMGEVTVSIKNTELLDVLNASSKGNWVKVYEAGLQNGAKIETHYFRNNTTNQVFDVKTKYDFWHQKAFKTLEQ